MIALTMFQSLPERNVRDLSPPTAAPPQVRMVLGVAIERHAGDIEFHRKRGLELRRQAVRELGHAALAWLRRTIRD